MKKILAVALAVAALMAFPLSARAEEKQKIDLSGMSYEELVELKDQINLAIWQSDEWQEVEVPQGVWKVGEDIPAGHWTIKAAEGAWVDIRIGSKLKEGGTKVETRTSAQITSPSYHGFDANKDKSEWSVEVKDGVYILVESGKAIFTPYAGKPSLGFKK